MKDIQTIQISKQKKEILIVEDEIEKCGDVYKVAKKIANIFFYLPKLIKRNSPTSG